MSQRWLTGLSVLAGVLLLFSVSSSKGQSPISSVRVGVNYSHYRGPCPAKLRFTGNINVDRYPMSYNYQWERSDGAKSELHVVRVNNPSQQHLIIHEDWTLSTHGEVWESLRVRSGNTDVTSEPARVIVECN
jgi:hypothetical protein